MIVFLLYPVAIFSIRSHGWRNRGERGEGLPPGPRNEKNDGVDGGNQPFIKRALFTDFAFLLPFLRGKLRCNGALSELERAL